MIFHQLNKSTMKKLDRIGEFIRAWNDHLSPERWFNHMVTESLQIRHDIEWYYRFRDAGYYSVRSTKLNEFRHEIHDWCREYIGYDRYAWTDTTFWFDNERDVILFTLRWA